MLRALAGLQLVASLSFQQRRQAGLGLAAVVLGGAPKFRSLDIRVGWWASEQGHLKLFLRAKKRNLPFGHGNKVSCPRLESQQEKPGAQSGVMKEAEAFPCPFQRWEFPHPTSWWVSSSRACKVEEPGVVWVPGAPGEFEEGWLAAGLQGLFGIVWAAAREVPLPFLDQHGNAGNKGMRAQMLCLSGKKLVACY